MNLNQLYKMQIRKYSTDRYPTVSLQFIKLVEEIGELASEINKDNYQAVIKECADVALCLGGLAEKLGFQLETAVEELVENDTRKFT